MAETFNNASVKLTTTSATDIYQAPTGNAADRAIVLSCLVANVDGTNACDVTVDVHSAASGGGTAYSLVSTASVAADSSLVVLDKNTAIYLEEDRSITATAGTASDLEVIVSYEEIS